MSTQTLRLEITASTTNDDIAQAIPYLDMREAAINARNHAMESKGELDKDTVAELHQIDGVDVLYYPALHEAYVNENSAVVGNSLHVPEGRCRSAKNAASQYRGYPDKKRLDEFGYWLIVGRCGLVIRYGARSKLFEWVGPDADVDTFDEALDHINAEGWHHSFHTDEAEALALARSGIICHGTRYYLDERDDY